MGGCGVAGGHLCHRPSLQTEPESHQPAILKMGSLLAAAWDQPGSLLRKQASSLHPALLTGQLAGQVCACVFTSPPNPAPRAPETRWSEGSLVREEVPTLTWAEQTGTQGNRLWPLLSRC